MHAVSWRHGHLEMNLTNLLRYIQTIWYILIPSFLHDNPQGSCHNTPPTSRGSGWHVWLADVAASKLGSSLEACNSGNLHGACNGNKRVFILLWGGTELSLISIRSTFLLTASNCYASDTKFWSPCHVIFRSVATWNASICQQRCKASGHRTSPPQFRDTSSNALETWWPPKVGARFSLPHKDVQGEPFEATEWQWIWNFPKSMVWILTFGPPCSNRTFYRYPRVFNPHPADPRAWSSWIDLSTFFLRDRRAKAGGGSGAAPPFATSALSLDLFFRFLGLKFGLRQVTQPRAAYLHREHP